MRGAHQRVAPRFARRRGSSPHAWGTHNLVRVAGRFSRFIPTCVGHTPAPKFTLMARSVHPHMRGAHAGRCFAACRALGSSPHAWGTQQVAYVLRLYARFIPTCVGHTCVRRERPSSFPVHPHMRGAHSPCSLTDKTKNGSSPHAWGTHGFFISCLRAYRFIPTCVGHTCQCRYLATARTVHPHMRGAHVPASQLRYAERGSSPHAWGTP